MTESSSHTASGLRYCESILETVGDTPLVRLNVVTKGLAPLVLAKLESFNPGKSNKDRVGIHIVEMAEREGALKPGGTIVEATSGNTGLGLALAAVVKGYKCVCVMPDKVGQEKRDILKAHGARVVITPTSAPPGSPDRYTEVAKRLAGEIPGGFLANQYFNPHNWGIHYLTTGPEIWRDTAGPRDVLRRVARDGRLDERGRAVPQGAEPRDPRRRRRARRLDPRRVPADREDRRVRAVPRRGDRAGDHPGQRPVPVHRRDPDDHGPRVLPRHAAPLARGGDLRGRLLGHGGRGGPRRSPRG